MAEAYVPADGGGFPLTDIPDTTVQVKRTKDGPVIHGVPGSDGGGIPVEDLRPPAAEVAPSGVDPDADILTRTAQARALALQLRDRRDAAMVAFETANDEYLELAAKARATLASTEL